MATTTMKKETKSQKFARLLALSQVQADPTLVEFIDHEMELLSKKNSSEKKPTKGQKENEALKDAIYDGMESNRIYTVTEVQKSIPGMDAYSNQKLSSMLRQMEGEGRVRKTVDKRTSHYEKVED